MTAAVDTAGLAIVIPVRNLPNDLHALLEQIEKTQVFSEVIVVDDASDTPCDPVQLGFSEARLGARLIHLRLNEQCGAGRARNRGLEAVTQDNVIFFDADDRLSDRFTQIWDEHRWHGFPDFTIFRHNDSRILQSEGREGSFSFEESLWSDILETQAVRLLSKEQRAHLSPIVAYPWNKIYRTEFLRNNGITCSETPVHNDIRLHWLSFVRATRVLAVRQIGALHRVEAGQHHLTNRRGEERLCLDGILATLTEDIRTSAQSHLFLRAFLSFANNVCMWNFHQADRELQPKFAALACEAFLRFTPEEFALFAQWQPETADAIVQFLLREAT